MATHGPLLITSDDRTGTGRKSPSRIRARNDRFQYIFTVPREFLDGNFGSEEELQPVNGSFSL